MLFAPRQMPALSVPFEISATVQPVGWCSM